MAKYFTPPVRHPVFNAYVELPGQKGRAPIRLPVTFADTSRPWAEYFVGVSRGISPVINSPALIALAALTPAADRVPYFTGADSAALAVFTAFARLLVAADDAEEARDVLGALAGIWPVTIGGTGLATVTQGDLLIATATDMLGALAKSAISTRYLANTGTDNEPKWDQINLTNGVTGRLPFANLAQGSALSVLGVTGNAIADLASIVAGTDFHVLRRSGAAVAFGQIATGGILDAAVTLAKMADLAQDKFIIRTTASTGVPETATCTAAARTVLDDTTVAAMVDTLGGAASTGTGGLARATSPTFVTPTLGVASATSINFGVTALSYYGEGTWTPTDTSGAALAFAAASGTWTRIGRVLFYGFAVTYPATADVNPAQIGNLPFTVAAGNENRQGFRSVTTEATCTQLVPNATTTTISPLTAVAGAITNVTLTGDLLWGGGHYNV